ncbi:TRAF-interacting protein [Fasciola hepatica]|uniref:TRAF-interacting protein n=1 Tax=Fasciola hepatica TaxID=6192 RepID=A0A4E0R7M9_FASHE|nr:TRAF-interacting protein [Fasciola hepatica]
MILAQCPVCQELFTPASDCFMSALPCGHVFHKKCVETWFRTSSTCPQCRVKVKRSSTVDRLFFDVVPFLPFEPLSNCSRVSQTPSSSQNSSSFSQVRDPNVQLFKAKSEINRLTEALQESENKLAQQSKLARDRENEVATLTTLYTESDKLCEKERQRSRDLKYVLNH